MPVTTTPVQRIARMMREGDGGVGGAGSDVVVDVDFIRDYVCSLCPRVASGRRLSVRSRGGCHGGTPSRPKTCPDSLTC